MINSIRLYLKRGLSLIPTNRANKLPFFKWGQWADEKALPKQWTEWWKAYPGCNVSVIYSSTDTPEGTQLVCVDTDTDVAEAWVLAQSDLPQTPTVETANGYHRYYLAPKGLRHFAGTKGLPEVRCGRHYSQLPPSIHPTGVVYSWVEGLSLEQVDFAPLPQWGIALMERAEEELPAAAHRKAQTGVSDRARRYGLAALQRHADELAATHAGGRNDGLNTAAFSLGQLIPSGCIEECEARQTLLAACQANGLLKDDGLKACEATLDGGLRAGQASPCDLPAMPDRQPRAAGSANAPTVAAGSVADGPPDVQEQGEYPADERDVPRRSVAPVALSDLADEMVNEFEEERLRDRAVRGLRTGFPSLDAHFCGFYRQQLVVVHGPSGYGKTHFANHVIFSTALAEMEKGPDAAQTIVFLCEGLKQNLLNAYLGYRWAVPERCREAGGSQYMTPEIEEAMALGFEEFRSLPIYVTDEIKKLVDIERYIRERVAEQPVAGVVIDHVQEVEAPGCENPSHQGVNKTVERLRDLSEKECHIPIVLLSQTTADQKGNFNPKFGSAIREKSSLCFMVDRGLPGQKREDAVQSNVMRVVNDKSRWRRVAPVLTLKGNYETGRMWEADEYDRQQAQNAQGWANNE